MASPLIGCKEKELLYITTESIDLTIKGKPCHPKADVLAKAKEYPSNLSISCKERYAAEIFSTREQNIQQFNDCIGYSSFKINPLFYEFQNYEVIIERKDERKITLWHDNNLVREKINYVGKSKRILTGILNFGSEIGFSEFKIYIEGNEYLKFNIEVFPSKISYQEDYINILRDVNDEIYNLALDFLKKTYLWSSLNDNVGNSLTEFFSIINIIFNKLKTSIDIILKTPHHVLKQESCIVPFNKIKKSSTATVKWLEKRPENMVLCDGRYMPNKALVVNKSISFDTFENRFIKYILKAILKKLSDVKGNYLKLERSTDEEIISNIEKIEKEIEKRIQFSFLKDVGDLYTLNSLSLVLNMAPGYKDVYKYYLILIKGLSLNGEVFKLSVKDLAVLYEYWCFIKLNALLKSKYKLLKQDLIKVDNSGLFVTLTKGRKASVTYENPANGEKFILVYNPQLGNLPTIAQRPDNVLSLEKERSKIRYEYIFDAKYRINPALEGTAYKINYRQPGPEEDDINTMHRYRDAIVHNASSRPDFERTMFGAYILFPYNNEEEYQHHKFFQSIDTVNIGGLPFLPSATKLVEDLLNELIEDSPESAFERVTLPSGVNDYINSIDFDSRDVLVGALKDEKQFEIALKYKFYHIPYNKVKNKAMPFKYIALYQSENIFKDESGINYYGEIDSWEILKRRDIKEIPKNSDELYIRFRIKEWNTLRKQIKAKEYGVRSHIYTNKQLLFTAEFIPELCIRTKEEYRLYIELRRFSDSVEAKIDNDVINYLSIGAATIYIENGNINVSMSNGVTKFSLIEFNLKPRTIINRINSSIK